VQPGILQGILLFCRESAKWRLDLSNASSLLMKNFCKLSVDGLKFVYLMVKLAGFVKENGMHQGGYNWGALKMRLCFKVDLDPSSTRREASRASQQ
jgi:hypothetical protein